METQDRKSEGTSDNSAQRGQNEGEGSRTAAHNYEAGVKRTVASGKVDELAEEAKDALDGAEGASLRQAEKVGKASLHSVKDSA